LQSLAREVQRNNHPRAIKHTGASISRLSA